MPAISSGLDPRGPRSPGFGFWEMSKFWQNSQRRLQWPKKIVPEPFQPRRQSSSPKWGKWLPTTAHRPVLHAPHLSARRSAPQSRGQSRQSSRAARASAARRRISSGPRLR